MTSHQVEKRGSPNTKSPVIGFTKEIKGDVIHSSTSI